MIDRREIDDTYRWTTAGLSPTERQALAVQNRAALDRKVTFCLARPEERVQFQPVEGWTTGQIIGYMHGRGLSLERILRDLSTASSPDGDVAAASSRPVVTYQFSRLCFRADVIEPLRDADRFRVTTPDGTYEMSKADFRRDFANVAASKSYRQDGIYHYPVTPRKAMQYRVD